MKFINKTLILFSVLALLNVPNAFSRDTEEIGEKFDNSIYPYRVMVQ